MTQMISALILFPACGRHFVENDGFNPSQFRNMRVELYQTVLGPAHLRLALGKLGRPLRLAILVLIGVGARKDGRAGSSLLQAQAKRDLFALGSLDSG